MKFAIGYQQPENGEPFSGIVRDYRDAVAEVYFPWPGMATGRPAMGRKRGMIDFAAQQELESELLLIRSMGVHLDLLFNANCYGERAVSCEFENEIGSVLSHLNDIGAGPETVTTASPFVASVIKKYFPQTEVRASVNMRIDSTLAMEYLGDLFDSFHIRRDLQRDLENVKRFHSHCRAHGKKLCLLANSGCLRNCPSQTFHDNLVAHDREIAERRNVSDFPPHLCRKLYNDRAHWVEFLRGSWLRPEDLKAYEPYFDVVKLATRLHTHPRMVIGAYASGHFRGNMADLLEPGFSPAFAPWIIDNSRFPANWLSVARGCASNCTHCGKCEAVLEQVLVKME